jgi:FkbH-like protein
MKIKLVIWDLDDTLWSGTLAENDRVSLFEHRAAVVRRLNGHGIVSAICSKNDHATAQAKLEEFGLWDEFVFRRIAFVPKGHAVAQIIDDMHLQAKHVLFVDDNRMNLLEVKHTLPEINTIDATLPDCDELLGQIIADNQHVDKSRVEEYRILDQKIVDQATSGASQEEFLKSCGVRVCLVHRQDNIDFADRIEEVINRTNQLNFLKSRIKEGGVPDLVLDIMRYECYSVVVWDKYGYHGLVGFAAVAYGKTLKHFAFSCRVMHMGIEEWMLAKLLKLYPKLDAANVPVTPGAGAWLKEEAFGDAAIRKFILDREAPQAHANAELRIMANCQSGALAHFSGLGAIAEFDNMPRFFNLSMMLNGTYKEQEFPEFLVFAPFSDYWEHYWPGKMRGDKFSAAFHEAASQFVDFVRQRGAKLLLVLPPDDAEAKKYGTVSQAVVLDCNSTFRELSRGYDGITILEVSQFAQPHELIEARHFDVSLLKKIAERISPWFTVVHGDPSGEWQHDKVLTPAA